jgi:hypothetical protein
MSNKPPKRTKQRLHLNPHIPLTIVGELARYFHGQAVEKRDSYASSRSIASLSSGFVVRGSSSG